MQYRFTPPVVYNMNNLQTKGGADLVISELCTQ